MARGILGGLFGGSDDSSVMPGLLDQAGYMDPAEYDRRRQGDAMQGLWAGLLQGSGPSLEPRNFFSALGGGLAASQKSANEFDEAQLRRAQGLAAFQKSALERQKLKLATDIYGEVLPKSGSTGAPPAPGAPAVGPDDAGGGSGRGAWGPHADVAIATLREQGFSDAAIQGIMANGLGEGGFDTPWRKAGGGENSFGHWQFNQGGELPGYLEWLQKQGGGDPKDTRLQALYVAKRAEEVSPGFKAIDDPQKATDLFATKFERYQGAAPGQRYGLLIDAQRYMTGKPVEAVAPLAEVPRYGSNFERLPSETAIPGLLVAGAPGPAPAPGATVIPDNALPGGTLPVPGHEYVRLPNGRLGLRPTTAGQMPAGDRLPTAVPPVTSTPGGTNGIDLRRGAALEQILSGQQTAMAGPPLRQLAQFAGPGAADSAAPEAPAPGGITYGSGVLGRAAAAAAAGAPATAVPAAAAPAPGGTVLGAAPAPALPAPPELPPIPAIAMPQPLPPPPAAAALRPLEATGVAPAVQLSPEQAARTQRAQRLSLSLDLIGVTVPKFIADEAGIDVAARSAAAQEVAKQPFAVQLKRLEAETTAAQKQWDAMSDQQKETLAFQRGLTKDQLNAQYANIHERFKSELDLFTAGPKAEAIAAAQLPSEKEKLTAAADERIREAGPIAEAQKRAQLQQEAALQPQIEYNKALMAGVGKQDSELYQAAQAAHKSLYGLDDARQQLAAGIYTGKGADLSLSLAKWGSALGWPNEKIANTETYIVQRAQEVANILGSRAFGAGTGISDEDRRQAEKIAAGGTTLDLASIKKVLDTSEKLNKYIIERWNNRAPNEKLQITPPPSRSPPPDATYYGRTQSGSPVYTMPDGSRKVID